MNSVLVKVQDKGSEVFCILYGGLAAQFRNLSELMSRLNESDRELVWAEIGNDLGGLKARTASRFRARC